MKTARTRRFPGASTIGRIGRVLARSGALAGFSAAAVGLVIFAVHSIGLALTEHIWSLIGQALLIGGGLLGLSQFFGGSRRKRR